MIELTSLADLRRAARSLPAADAAARDAAQARQATLTKPSGSLGRLEELAAWLAAWQGSPHPALERVEVLVFAGNHGVARRGVSAYPAEVTAQMVANFAAGGAAINQLSRTAGASLRVEPMRLDRPTEDFTRAPAMSETEFLDAVRHGAAAVAPDLDLLCLGEMGIGNTTAASALAAGLFGGPPAAWAGRGTGLDEAGLVRKQAVLAQALACHAACLDDPLDVARRLGGFELAAILGAVLGARRARIPVLLDGFVCTAAAAPLMRLDPEALAHCRLSHLSAEAGHRRLAETLGQAPLLDLGLRLGEASGAALAVPLLRAAIACHNGMASFAQAGVDAATP